MSTPNWATLRRGARAHAGGQNALLYIIQNLPREASTLQTAIGELESEIVSETELQALVRPTPWLPPPHARTVIQAPIGRIYW